jgi:hypothetical protein
MGLKTTLAASKLGWGLHGVGTVCAEKRNYFLRRGRPFGHPPFFAFSFMAANFAALLDFPPFLPI